MQLVAEYGEQVLQAGRHLGPYRFVKHLRQGGMASVYLGCHLKRKAYVALNVADSDTADLMLLRAFQKALDAPAFIERLSSRFHFPFL